MPKKNSDYKIKLLVLYEILKQQTDEDHRLTTKELIAQLAEHGISCDRKILYNDIATLNDNGFEVLTQRGQQMEYFVPEAGFNDYELRILIDAVQSANFITEKKTKILNKKITSLAGSHKEDFVKENITCYNEKKSTNENIFYIIDAITRAIKNGKKIAFKYFDLDLAGNKTYRKNGEFYTESPIDLVIDQNKYYLIVYSERHDDIGVFRVDRMDKVEVTHEDSLKKKVKEAQEFRNDAFSMLSGEEMIVRFEFDKSITGQVIDKFGHNLFCESETDTHATVRGKATVSDTFYAWVFTFGDKMKLLGPDTIVDAYKRKLAGALNNISKN